jgi:ABC-type multidrug transport system fused ATPase/permease subunit
MMRMLEHRSVSKDLKREDAASKGPLYSHFNEVCGGLEVIRGYGIETKLIATHHFLLDRQLHARLNWDAANRWLGIHLDLIGVLIVFFAAFCLAFNVQTISSGLAGLIISYAMRTTQSLSFAIRSSTALENSFTSPERVFELIQVEQEDHDPEGDAQTPALQPTTTSVPAFAASNLVCRYSENLPVVLDHVSFQLFAGELLGVCGRTGSGKSTLSLAVSRCLEGTCGDMTICGVDCEKLSLSSHRQLVQVYPQDSYILSGTVRDFLDPHHVFPDLKLNNLLQALNTAVQTDITCLSSASADITLSLMVASGGSNLSAGQKQILVLARASLATEARIVILDEITSNLDARVAKKAIQILRQELVSRGMAVLMIAHCKIHTLVSMLI